MQMAYRPPANRDAVSGVGCGDEARSGPVPRSDRFEHDLQDPLLQRAGGLRQRQIRALDDAGRPLDPGRADGQDPDLGSLRRVKPGPLA